jgi:hypothetical protein
LGLHVGELVFQVPVPPLLAAVPFGSQFRFASCAYATDGRANKASAESELVQSRRPERIPAPALSFDRLSLTLIYIPSIRKNVLSPRTLGEL